MRGTLHTFPILYALENFKKISRANRPTRERCPPEHVCPLLAKDSEWVDILQTDESDSSKTPNEGGGSDEEEVLQLVECEDGLQMKPLAIMFPGLLDKDPQTLNGMLNKAMSTTEVTRQLVDLGQKANFNFMKKADRLIPPDRQWLESLTENSNSIGSLDSGVTNAGISSSTERNTDTSQTDSKLPKKKTMINSKLNLSFLLEDSKRQENEQRPQDT